MARPLLLLICLSWFCLVSGLKFTGNYECNNTTPLLPGPTIFDNTDSTSTTPYDTCAISRNFLWYSYTNGGSTGYKQLTVTNNGGFQPVLAVYNECADFPANYNACEGSTNFINFQALNGQTYYISLAGTGENYTGEGTLSLSEVNLLLTVLTPSIYNLGGVVEYKVDAPAVNSFFVQISVICESYVIAAFTTFTSNEVQNFTMPQGPPGSCTVMASDYFNPGLVSNNSSFIMYGLLISEPIQDFSVDAGSPFEISITSNDVNNTDFANVTINCGSPSGITQYFQVTVNTPFQGAVMSDSAWGWCAVSALSSQMTSYFPTSILVKTELTISAPSNNSVISIEDDYPFLNNAVSTATGQPSTICFASCIYNAYGNFPVLVNQVTFREIPNVFAGDTCTVITNGTTFFDSPPIQVSFWNPLELNGATNLNGWTGGDTVTVVIDSLSQRFFDFDLLISCPISSVKFTVTTQTANQILLPVQFSGIGCTLNTINLPAYAVPIDPVSVNINLNPVVAKEILSTLQLSSFSFISQ